MGTLNKKFVVQNYYVATMIEILPFSGYFCEQFKQRAMPKFPDPQLRNFFGRNDNNSPYTDMFINLCFKEGIDLTAAEFDMLRGSQFLL